MREPERGQAMVEFALALPVLVLLISLVWDCGFRAWSAVSLRHAAQTAARAYASELPEDPAGALSSALVEAKRAYKGPSLLTVTSLRELPPFRGPALSDHMEYREQGPSTRTLELHAHLQRAFRLPGMDPALTMVARASILDEDTQERRRAD